MSYFLDTDNDGHWYVVRADRESEWDAWVENEDAWDVPDYAVPVGGWPGLVRFDSYRIQ